MCYHRNGKETKPVQGLVLSRGYCMKAQTFATQPLGEASPEYLNF